MLNFHEIREKFWSYLIANEFDNSWLGALSALCIPIFGYFIVGIYFLLTFHLERNPVFERPWSGYIGDFFRPSGPTPASMQASSHIGGIKQYRDSVLAGKTCGDGAEEYMQTAWLDGIENNSGSHTNSVTSYIDSKLASMTNHDGYEWIKSQGSK
jgi:hypothetical protein